MSSGISQVNLKEVILLLNSVAITLLVQRIVSHSTLLSIGSSTIISSHCHINLSNINFNIIYTIISAHASVK